MKKKIISIFAGALAILQASQCVGQAPLPPLLEPSTPQSQVKFQVNSSEKDSPLGTSTFTAGTLPILWESTSYDSSDNEIELLFVTNGQLDYRTLSVSLDPATEFRAHTYGNTVYLSGDFTADTKYRITVEKGLSDNKGSVLEEDVVSQILIPDKEPRISFVTRGQYLPLNSERLLFPYQAINCKTVSVKIERAYENNLNPYYEIDWIGEKQMVEVGKKEFKFDPPKNVEILHEVDIESILKERTPGAYKITLSANNKSYTNGRNEQTFYLTDMAVQAVSDVSQSRMAVFIRSLSTGKPVAKAQITVLSRKNQLVAKGHTNNDGSLVVEYDLGWNREDDSVVGVFAKKGDDISYFRLDSSTQDMKTVYDSFSLKGYQPNEPKAFVFAERGACRPGESFSASVFLRQPEANSYKPMGNVPVSLIVWDPGRRQFAKANLQTDEYGFAQTTFPINETAQTGVYDITCTAAGGTTTIGGTSIQIATYVADTLKVFGKCTSPAPSLSAPIGFEFDAQYYFGMPVSQPSCQYSFSSKLAPRLTHWDKTWSYGGEKFYVPSRYHYNSLKNFSTPIQIEYPGFGELKGEVFQPVLICAEMSVADKGSPWVTKEESVLVHPTPWYIGLREGASSGKKKTIDFTLLPALANEDKTLPAPTEISFSLIRKEWEYVVIKTIDGSYRREWQLHEYPLYDLTLVDTLPSGTKVGGWDKQVSWELGSGQYEVIAKCGDLYKSVLEFTHYSGEGGGRSSNPYSLYFKTDSELYQPGQTVNFTFDAPGNGEAFLAAGEKGLEEKKIIPVKQGKNTLQMSIPKDIHTGSYYIHCTVVSKNDDSFLRSSGLLKVMVDQTQKHFLTVEIDSPKTAEPEEEIPVTIHLKKADGTPEGGRVCLYAVDSGVISLTEYKAPNIFDCFFGAIACPMSFYDMYGLIYENLKITPDGRIGGDEDGESKIQRIKQKDTARIICPPVLVPPTGSVTVSMKLPEHVGALDIFAVGSSVDYVGSTTTSVAMCNNVTVTASVPSYIAPGDTTTLTLGLFNNDSEQSDYLCTISLPESLEPATESSLTQSGSLKKGEQTQWILPVRAKEIFTSDSIRAHLKIGNDESKASAPITVRSIYVSEKRSDLTLLEPGQTKQISLEGDYVGTPESTLVLSASPAVGVESALNWLNDYPYGCLEQTVAGVFPFVGVPALVKAGLLDEALAKSARPKISMGYAQILQMALYDGSFSMWPNNTTPWVEGSLFANHFIFSAESNSLLSIDSKTRKSYLNRLVYFSGNRFNNSRINRAYAAYIIATAGEKSFANAARNIVADSTQADYALFLAGAALVKGGFANLGIRPMEEALKAQCWKNEGVPTPYSDESCRLGMTLFILMDCNVQNDELATRLALELAKLLRTDGSCWGTTQANAWATLGLAAYAQKYPSTPTQVEIVDEDGQRVLDIATSAKIKADKVKSITNTSKGVLIAETIVSGIPRSKPATTDGKLELSREYLNENGQPITEAQLGEKVYVRINFNSPVPLENIAIADLLPAGLAIEDETLSSRSSLNNPLFSQSVSDNCMITTRQEKRDDRFLIFGDTQQGKSVFYYQTRATSRGVYAVPPLHAEAMYQPEMKGAFYGMKQFTVK